MDMSEVTKLDGSSVDSTEAGPASGALREYVTAWLSDAEYAFESSRVRQIRRFDGSAPDAIATRFVVGRIGSAPGPGIPVVDLRLMNGPAPVTYSDTMLVVVVGSSQGNVGVVVDSISDLVDLEPSPDQTVTVDGCRTAFSRKITHGPDGRHGHFAVYVPNINHIVSLSGAAGR